MSEGKKYIDIPCTICGTHDYTVLQPAAHQSANEETLIEQFRSSGDAVLTDQLVRCNACELIYVTPRLHNDIIVSSYTQGSDEAFISQACAREKSFEQYIPLIKKYAHTGTLLDIGTAGGSFLSVAKKYGWDVRGIEPSTWLSTFGRSHYGVTIDQGTLFDHQYQDKHFDLITLWDVLEHVDDPYITLLEVKRILKDDGLIIINYPNVGSMLAKLTGRKWWFYLSVHLYYFTPRTIKLLLTKAGFTPFKTMRHIQKLEFGYLIKRLSAYSKPVAAILGLIARATKLEKLQIPYYASQRNVLARKTR